MSMSMRRNKKIRDTGLWVVGGLAFSALVASCASTDMTSTWTDPTAKGASLSKVAVICLTKDPGLRRMAEDTTAANLQAAQAYPSYQIVDDADLKDRELVKRKLKAAGMNAVLVMRMTGVTKQVTPMDGPYYGSFDRYYDYAAVGVYSPDYLQTDTIVHMVSNLYDLDQNKLIWSGVSQTFDPASAKSYMNDVSKAVAKSLQKDRLVL